MENVIQSIGQIVLSYGSWGGIAGILLYMALTRGKRRAETKKINTETEIELNKQALSVIDTLHEEIKRLHLKIERFRGRVESLEKEVMSKESRINLLQSRIEAIAIKCPTCPVNTINK